RGQLVDYYESPWTSPLWRHAVYFRRCGAPAAPPPLQGGLWYITEFIHAKSPLPPKSPASSGRRRARNCTSWLRAALRLRGDALCSEAVDGAEMGSSDTHGAGEAAETNVKASPDHCGDESCGNRGQRCGGRINPAVLPAQRALSDPGSRASLSLSLSPRHGVSVRRAATGASVKARARLFSFPEPMLVSQSCSCRLCF
ncbi:hypothetical protein NDU88_004249, partial [Pleurodeles waltl]